jgi:hypothetical protein
MSQTLPNDRISKVASHISTAFNGVLTKDGDRRDAREVYQAASNDATSAREEQLIRIAKIAFDEHWSQYEVDEGTAQAINSRNAKDTSVNTYANEIKRACHPNARQHVGSLAKLANTVWDAENVADKKLPRPLRAAFSRKYHLLQRMISEAIDNEHVLALSRDVVSFAIAHDPAKNPERMFKRFKNLREQLKTLADEFPLDELNESVENLRGVGLSDFKYPSSLKTSREPAEAGKAVSGGKVPGEDNAPIERSQNAPDNDQELRGVSDLLDEALHDIESH